MTITHSPSLLLPEPTGGRPRPLIAILVVHPADALGKGAALHRNEEGIGAEFDVLSAAQLDEVITRFDRPLPGMHATVTGEDKRQPPLPVRHAAALDWAATLGYRGVGYWSRTFGLCGSMQVGPGRFAAAGDEAGQPGVDFILVVDAHTEWECVDDDSDDEVICPADDETLALTLATRGWQGFVFFHGDELVDDPGEWATSEMQWAVLRPRSAESAPLPDRVVRRWSAGPRGSVRPPGVVCGGSVAAIEGFSPLFADESGWALE